jgi:hypothetical protein
MWGIPPSANFFHTTEKRKSLLFNVLKSLSHNCFNFFLKHAAPESICKY